MEGLKSDLISGEDSVSFLHSIDALPPGEWTWPASITSRFTTELGIKTGVQIFTFFSSLFECFNNPHLHVDHTSEY